MQFKTWLAEVGQTGGVGGGLDPERLDPSKLNNGAMPKYNKSDDPPVGWSKERRNIRKKMKR